MKIRSKVNFSPCSHRRHDESSPLDIPKLSSSLHQLLVNHHTLKVLNQITMTIDPISQLEWLWSIQWATDVICSSVCSIRKFRPIFFWNWSMRCHVNRFYRWMKLFSNTELFWTNIKINRWKNRNRNNSCRAMSGDLFQFWVLRTIFHFLGFELLFQSGESVVVIRYLN